VGKVKHSQYTKGEGESRGDQEEKGRPGNPTHELAEENVKRHFQKPQFQMSKFKCQTNDK
jgi:hypothetical protein